MQEIIDEVLEAERKAEQMIAEARKRQGEIRKAAEEEAARGLEEAHTAAQRLMEEKIGRARKEAEREHQRRIQEAEAEGADYMAHHESRLEGILEEAVSLVVTPEYKRK